MPAARRSPTTTRWRRPRAARRSSIPRVDAFGTVDIVVNNAGFLRDQSFAKMTADNINAIVDVHLKGAFFVSRPAFAVMKEKGYGRFVHTTSGAGLFGNFGQANYAGAKMGLVGLSSVIAIEGQRSNINSNVIAPLARTRLTEELMGPLAEFVAPEQVSGLVAYLASRRLRPQPRGVQRRRRPHRPGVRRPVRRVAGRQGRGAHARGRHRPTSTRSATPMASPSPSWPPRR